MCIRDRSQALGQICPRSPGQAGQYWACRGWYVHHAINYFIGGSVASHIHDDFGTQFTGLSGECACVTRSLSIDLSLIHISEPTRRTPISYAVFCLKKKKKKQKN